MISIASVTPHRSIASLERVDLPDLTVITGVNGAGKTHLLEAIYNGSVQVSGIEVSRGNIKLLTPATLKPKPSTPADPVKIEKDHAALVSGIEADLKNLRVKFQSLRSNLQGGENLGADEILGFSDEAFREYQSKIAPRLRSQVVNFRMKFTPPDRNSGDRPRLIEQLLLAAGKLNKTVLELSKDEISSAIAINRTAPDLFDFNFSAYFATYHYHYETNRYKLYLNATHGTSHRALQAQQFTEEYGAPPWLLVNEFFAKAELDFRVTFPEGPANVPFVARLNHRVSGATISFDELSSGEKVMTSIALGLFNMNEAGRLGGLPKILLLDEVDAPLHPTLARRLVETIKATFVEQRNIKVILTTHSPATVAFSPKESVFLLTARPTVLRSCSRELAIHQLTQGYVTVTENTRFVITEAAWDRRILTEIYETLVQKRHLPILPNLAFLQATDVKDNSGGGCSQVKNWGEKFQSAGLTQICGLIDRDQANIGSPGVHVLDRYSLENYLLDPIIVYAIILDHGLENSVADIGIARRNYYLLESVSDEQLQIAADGVMSMIERWNPDLKRTRVSDFQIKYANGRSIVARSWLRDCRGHDLVVAYREAFRTLNNGFIVTKNECGDLVEMMTKRIPGFVPECLLQLLQRVVS